MTNMQRWTWADVGKVGPKAALYVTYADHVEAIAQAKADALNQLLDAGEVGLNKAYAAGQCDMLAKCIAVLETHCVCGDSLCEVKSAAAALRALEEKP